MPAPDFESVMTAGFEEYPVGKLLGKGSNNSRVVFAAPPSGDRNLIVKYHNMLVDLCQVSNREFTEALQKNLNAAAL